MAVAAAALLLGGIVGFWLGSSINVQKASDEQKELSDTRSFFDCYLEADGNYLEAREFRAKADNNYSKGANEYGQKHWETAIYYFNSSMKWYKDMGEVVEEGINRLANIRNFSLSKEHKELAGAYLEVLGSYRRMSTLSYDASKYLWEACRDYKRGEEDEAQRKTTKANNLIEVLNDELKTYNQRLTELNNLLKNWTAPIAT